MHSETKKTADGFFDTLWAHILHTAWTAREEIVCANHPTASVRVRAGTNEESETFHNFVRELLNEMIRRILTSDEAEWRST